MKLFIIIFFLAGLNASLFSQNHQDKKEVIQLCIDLPETVNYKELSEEVQQPLVIINNGKVPDNLRLIKFGMAVKFMDRNELFFYNIDKFIDFEFFEIKSDKAEVIFNSIDGRKIEVRLIKANDSWEIINKKVNK